MNDAALEALFARPYHRQNYNCAHFAVDVWRMITGEDIGPFIVPERARVVASPSVPPRSQACLEYALSVACSYAVQEMETISACCTKARSGTNTAGGAECCPRCSIAVVHRRLRTMPTNKITLCRDPFDPRTWQRTEADNASMSSCKGEFDTFPADARIYHGQVSEENDVTPRNEAGIESLGKMQGDFYVVLYPADPVTLTIALVSVAIAAAFLIEPEVPNVASPDLNNLRSQSANNRIAQRQNQPRVGSRIPDIFGTVRAFPDLLSVPYRRFIGNIEYEYAYMCLGRGEYEIDAESIREGSTRLSQIGGTGVEIYDP